MDISTKRSASRNADEFFLEGRRGHWANARDSSVHEKKPNRARRFAWKNGRAKRAYAAVFTNWRMTAHATSVGRAGSSVLKLTRFRRGCLGREKRRIPNEATQTIPETFVGIGYTRDHT